VQVLYSTDTFQVCASVILHSTNTFQVCASVDSPDTFQVCASVVLYSTNTFQICALYCTVLRHSRSVRCTVQYQDIPGLCKCCTVQYCLHVSWLQCDRHAVSDIYCSSYTVFVLTQYLCCLIMTRYLFCLCYLFVLSS